MYTQNYDERVDIYSFGNLLIELLTKEFPYQECKHSMEIYQKVTSGVQPEALSKISNPLARQLVAKCIEFNPNERITL